jgi:glycerol-3-phosphate acyltransferase PlsX
VSLPVALDAMGGDGGAAPNIEGALAAARHEDARVILVGDSAAITRELERHGAHPNVTVAHASERIEMGDKPADAARKKKDSSMRVACDLVAKGAACGALSAGNSGAMLATSLLVFGRIDGVARPAIGTMLPTLSPIGASMLVDAGANTECTARHLAEWAILGATYVERVHGLARPPVGVVSNGEEDTKGTPLTRDALALLRRTDLHVLGHVEGRTLNAGACVVFVTDGFTGNVLLKTAEGVFTFVKGRIRAAYERGSLVEKLGGALSQSVFARISSELDPRELGAAPLLGLARPAFIAHGSSDAYAIRRAIGRVRAFAQHDLVEHMKDALAKNAAALAGAPS